MSVKARPQYIEPMNACMPVIRDESPASCLVPDNTIIQLWIPVSYNYVFYFESSLGFVSFVFALPIILPEARAGFFL